MIDLLDKENLTEEDIKKLIDFNVEESIHLDFKQSESLGKTDKKKLEIAKDISAFANSAGGYIVYGIIEKNHKADSLSFIDGNEITKEWIEQIIQSRIQRKIENLKITPIRFDNDIAKSIYVIKIPESLLAPHMTSDKRFYKRYNFESVQMEEYEVRNLYNRKEKTKLKIDNIITSSNLEYENNDGKEMVLQYLGFQVENIGNVIEEHFKLIVIPEFSEFNFRFNQLQESKPNEFLSREGRAISFANSHPIFPGEVMIIGYFDFALPRDKKDSIVKNAKFKLELVYSNGKDLLEVDANQIIKGENKTNT